MSKPSVSSTLPVPSAILQSATRALLPVILLMAIVVMFQGHNKPGGGFIAGLMIGACVTLHAFAFGATPTRRRMRIDPRTLIGLGLAAAFLSLLIPLALARPLMTGAWTKLPLPGMEPFKLGSPMLFDFGVFLTVAGVASEMVLTLLREPHNRARSRDQ